MKRPRPRILTCHENKKKEYNTGSDSRAAKWGQPILHPFGARVQLAVTGLSPQVVTETCMPSSKTLKRAYPHGSSPGQTAEGKERAR
jgi:hypothetical protein